MDLACNLVWILYCDFIVELLANSNLDKTIVGSHILLQIWVDRWVSIPLFTPLKTSLYTEHIRPITSYEIFCEKIQNRKNLFNLCQEWIQHDLIGGGGGGGVGGGGGGSSVPPAHQF